MAKLTLESLFGNEYIDYNCPKCNHEIKIRFGEVLHDGNSIECPNCRVKIEFTHPQETKNAINNMSRALNDLEKSLKSLEKTLKRFDK